MVFVRDVTARLGLLAALCLLPAKGEYKNEIIVSSRIRSEEERGVGHHRTRDRCSWSWSLALGVTV